MKLHGDHFAQAGFLALVPDLFHGKVAENDDEAAKMIGTFDFQKAVGEVGEAVAYLRSHPRESRGGRLLLGRRAHARRRTLRTGLGGGGAVFMAFRGFHPTSSPTSKRRSADTTRGSTTGRNPSVAEEIQRKVRSGGGQMDLHVYNAEHAIMRSTDSSKYEPKSAALARQRTVDFLHRHID